MDDLYWTIAFGGRDDGDVVLWMRWKMLIHKTMKMPTSCLSCWIAPTCEVWVREKSKYKGYDDRLDECPLEEVKHGRWIDMGDFEQCSVCYGTRLKEVQSCYGKMIWLRTPYCPECGAKMDEVEND